MTTRFAHYESCGRCHQHPCACPRSEQVTLPEVRPGRDCPTIPAPRLSEPLTHEQWIEMQRVFCDLAEHERALLLDVGRELRAKPLPAGKRVAWSAIVVVDREREAFRMGVVE